MKLKYCYMVRRHRVSQSCHMGRTAFGF